MPFETHNGVSFHVEELGAPGASPVVMLHGLLVGSMASWYFTAAAALARTHRVRLYDLRGHGKSGRALTGYDVGTMASDLESLVRAFSPDAPVALVGHSYGAAVALEFAIEHPSRVTRLVLVEAPVPASRLDELDRFLARTPGDMAAALPEALKSVLARRGRQATRFVESLRFLASDSSLLADLRSATDPTDDALRRVACPVLCVYGTRSSCRGAGERLARALPDATLRLVEGGHFLPTEAPRAVSDAIRGFLDG